MRFALVTLGSTGDLYPFLAIGRALREQGHEVFLLSQAPHGRDAVRAGLQFIPVADALAHERTLAHPKLWHPVDGLGVFWRHLCLPAAQPTWEALRRLSDGLAPGRPLRVLASPLAVGARLARDTLPIRLWTAYLSPAALRKLDDPMFLGPWQVPTWVPLGWRSAAWLALDRWKLEPMARGPLSTLATQLGARPPEGSVFGDWIHSPDGGLALYDAAFAPLPRRLHGALSAPSRLERLHQVGFPNFEWASPVAATSPKAGETRSWVLFGGSGGTHGAEHAVCLARELVARSGRPCILLEPARDTTACESQTQVTRLPMQALPPLLGRAHAFVHHGGIGSCAQGLTAGVPQILMPRAYDQFENAAAIQRMGMGWVMPGPIQRASPARQAAWIAVRSKGIVCAAPMSSGYSVPGQPNAAVREALRRLTAD
ncbi:nucleotide disphospho-sugar-binding domain-containing protein [Ideonella dechloratans]|uniref:nucleotide disphospho-sugar-binding domain-containing protein n=1 Tax=Ideonella dechloratans TaxID=36863 RepID=UPI0035B091BA